ncbi:hypothetical protein HK44_004880 [Pseudomonas fluorescens HK44]|uniref:Glycosaminoglycan attachment site n=1 Tax=Pseudomonas fluorescens HK44 TaxID=1042209 RepID=A0A010SPJ7_PSEFL|nr:hypothetical protein [Pseudomonas fluorescens]EXF93033.1 hypothetical protein HK44_004880 [Pseudomonas fluorescens HK44]
MKFQSITREKFEAYFYGRSPYVQDFTSESMWFSFQSDDVTLLAVMLLCRIDNDYNAVILGRDLNRKFRAVHVESSLPTPDALITALDGCIAKLVDAHVEGMFPQGDEAPSPFAIFASKVPPRKQNHYLKLLINDPVYFPARVVMEELAHWFEDPDGIFIRGLQGNEFNSRLFELYLHAAFYEQDFEIDHSYPQPDYLLMKRGMCIAVEAVTVAELEAPDGSYKNLDESALKSLISHIEHEMPFKFHRTLIKKVRHRPEPAKLAYWELEHTKGHPFVIAIHDYSRNMSMAMSAGALQKYLYGMEVMDGKVYPIERHEFEGRTIPSNFFGKEVNKHVAAVMLVTGATLPKFNRMGRVAGIRSPTSFAVVDGVRTDFNGNPYPFKAVVEHPAYSEAWHDGITIFHNPNAINPLDPELFPQVIHCFQSENGFTEYLPPNFMISSITQMIRFEESESEKMWAEMDLLIERHKGE